MKNQSSNGGRLSRVSLRAWLIFESVKSGVTENAIFMRLQRGKYPGLQRVRRNQRVVDVLVPAGLVAQIAPNMGRPPLGVVVAGHKHDKRQAPLSKVKMCECGNVAVRGRICLRCAELESRLYGDFKARGPSIPPAVDRGLTEHVLHLGGVCV